MKAVMIGTWHVHSQQYAEAFANEADCQLTAVWDPDPQKASAFAEKFNIKAYSDLDALYQKENFDGVIICSATNEHVPLIVRAAKEGKHIYAEKVLALTLEGAKKIRDAVIENDVRLVISYLHKCSPGLIFAKEMLQKGALGQVTYARVRNAHDGSISGWLPPHFYNKDQCGGGAMIDLGAHPMYLLLWLLGDPVAVSSTFTSVTGKPVEDNAVSILTYANGAIGVSETGFVSRFGNYMVEISGTEGAIRITEQQTLIATAENGGNWVEAKLPDAAESPMKQWIGWVTRNEPAPEFGIEEAVRLTKLMEAAYQSYHSGASVELNDIK